MPSDTYVMICYFRYFILLQSSRRLYKKKLFLHHTKDVTEVLTPLGDVGLGVVSLDGYYLQSSKDYYEKIAMALTTVQPYRVKQWEYLVDDDNLAVHKSIGE